MSHEPLSSHPADLDPIAIQAIAAAPGLGIDPYRVAVALGVDLRLADRLLADRRLRRAGTAEGVPARR